MWILVRSGERMLERMESVDKEKQLNWKTLDIAALEVKKEKGRNWGAPSFGVQAPVRAIENVIVRSLYVGETANKNKNKRIGCEFFNLNPNGDDLC